MDDFESEINGYQYGEEQLIELLAKLEVARMMIKRGTELAKSVENDIKFYRIANGVTNDPENN